MSDSNQNVIYGINGPVVTIRGATTLRMMEMVYVGNARLVGEVIGLDAEQTTIFIGIIRIKKQCQVFGNIFFVKRDTVTAARAYLPWTWKKSGM